MNITEMQQKLIERLNRKRQKTLSLIITILQEHIEEETEILKDIQTLQAMLAQECRE